MTFFSSSKYPSAKLKEKRGKILLRLGQPSWILSSFHELFLGATRKTGVSLKASGKYGISLDNYLRLQLLQTSTPG